MSAAENKDVIALLLDIQRKVDALARSEQNKRARKLKGRTRKAVHSPGALPGPKPNDLDIARAKRVLRRA